MKIQKAKVITKHGEYKVIRDSDAKYNKYKVYIITREYSQYGLRERRKKLIEYGDFASAMYYVYALLQDYNEE